MGEKEAEELTLAWKETRGRPIPIENAEAVLITLRHRGYRLGVISNSMSSLDIPRSLKTFGWQDYFEVVILSALVKYRKPAPEIFHEAVRAINVVPAHCAFVGNRATKDIVGCKRAGFALAIFMELAEDQSADEQVITFPPDAVIHSLDELLDIFPGRGPLELKM